MSKPIIIIEKTVNSSIFAEILQSKYSFISQTLDGKIHGDCDDPLLIIVNIHLENSDNIIKLSECLKVLPPAPIIALVNDLEHESTHIVEELGAKRILKRPTGLYNTIIESKELSDLSNCIKEILQKSTQNLWIELTPNEKLALEQVNSVNEMVMDAIIAGESIPKEEVTNSCNQLIDSLHEGCIGDWLNAVKTHHSYTHRHSITVTGIAVAFGMHFNMPRSELSRLATGALMHDIGKIKIPLRILDKPGKLTDEEMELVKEHPVHSAAILAMDGQFDEFTIKLAKYHHEMLDGSGYPDGLYDEQIPDSVRMLTIIDIFSALVDQRSYKKSMTGSEALEIMERMEGKLDLDLLKAFKPIALKIPTPNVA